MDGIDRRRAERHSANLFMVLVDPKYKDSIGRGVVIDVSSTGLAIETESDLALNTPVECQVEIPFAIQAKVVRRISSGQIKRYGLLITKMGFLDRFLLKKAIKGRLQTKKV